jgi:hypothetical protein
MKRIGDSNDTNVNEYGEEYNGGGTIMGIENSASVSAAITPRLSL